MASKNNNLASRLQNNYVLSPITALDIYHVAPDQSLVLAGEDTYLRVYDVATSKPLGQVKIFHSQPIHGIHVSRTSPTETETRVLIWGGQSVAVLSHASLQVLIQGGHVPQPRECKAPDWIYDGIISPYDSHKGVLVTAHNEIVPFCTSLGGEEVAFGVLTSPSRPILYSANLAWLSPETVLVAGGTVFGEIIVWKYYTTPSGCQWELLYVFTGHEGSIFGVSISPEIELTPSGKKIRVLASCSDDRTIRIWDITETGHEGSVLEAPVSQDSRAVLGDARETGFGGDNSNSEAKEEHQNDSARCLAVAMGHLSRIWHVKFTGKTNHHSPKETPIEVWSFGEDCTRQRWELSLDVKRWEESATSGYTTVEGEPIGVLKHCGTNPCHIGKNIWSAAVSLAPGGGGDQPLVVSGGADGKIAISGGQPENDYGSGYSDMDFTLSVDEVLQSLGAAAKTSSENQTKKSAKEGFQRYAFLSEQSFLATTTSGRLLLGNTTKSSISWEAVGISEDIMADLKIYNVVKSPAPGIVVLGSASGRLYLFQKQQELRELTRLPNKVSDIICLQDPSQRPNTWTIIATVLGQDHALMLTFEGTNMVSSRRIDLRQHFVITAAAFCNGRLILGSRIGVLAVQKAKDDNGFETEYSRKDCKTKDAVTCIIPLPGSDNSFLAGCRDGRYRIYTLSVGDSKDEAVLHLQHEISPPLGMIEGAWFAFSPESGIELVLYGFRGNNFIVWSETSRQELASVECGGAHRPFDTIAPLASNPNPNQTQSGPLKLVFTKAAQMHFYSQRGPFLRSLKEGGHGRELRGVAASSSSSRRRKGEKSKYQYIATAAEDTTIRIWQYSSDNGKGSQGSSFKPLAVLEKHSAGIQHLKWHGNAYLLSSAGQEEFFVWRVTRIESEYESLAVVCEAVYNDKSGDGDLRIVDFDVSSLTACARGEKQEDEQNLLISFALSNSEIKSYVYSKSKGFKLLVTGRYTGACLTQIRHLEVIPGEDDGVGIHLLTGSTDGYVAIWSTSTSTSPSLSPGKAEVSSREYCLSSVAKVHQSTVKSLDIAPINGEGADGWLVATGGDDNALGFTRLAKSTPTSSPASQDKDGEYTVTDRSRIAGAHAAAITGLTFVDGGADGESEQLTHILHVATASNDQRVKLWRVELGSSSEAQPPRVSLVDNQYSSVADPGDVEVIPSNSTVGGGQNPKGKFMVGGVGMEVWDLR